MAGFTNKGKMRTLEAMFRGGDAFYIALCTSANAPGPDTNVLGDLTQIATGNGYVDGGYGLTGNATDFDTLTEDDTADRGLVMIKDVGWTASGGPIPSSGGGARYAVLTDDNVTVADREVLGYWDLEADWSVVAGGLLALQDLELRINES